MRLLILLRHAKAVTDEGVDDRARPLTQRGRDEAVETAKAVVRMTAAPAILIASDARRTQETADRVAASFNPPLPVQLDPALYAAAPATILARIHRVENTAATLIVVGHNPGIGDLARSLAGQGHEAELNALRARFPTAGLAAISFDATNWRDVAEERGRLVAFVVPGGIERS